MSGIKNVYDEVGGFGMLLLITGKDWGTLEQRTRSMERFMAEVAPRLARARSGQEVAAAISEHSDCRPRAGGDPYAVTGDGPGRRYLKDVVMGPRSARATTAGGPERADGEKSKE